MAKKKHKCTQRHFEIFKKECAFWIEYYDLSSYAFTYEHKKDDPDYTEAKCHYFTIDRHATITLLDNWERKPNDDQVRLAAFHEISEVFFGDVRTLGDARYVEEHEIRRAVHSVIRTLEHKLYPLKKHIRNK